ncbi:hypothetical protein LV75_006062 [Actinokineospora diospyrosa]|uniref:Uncharacterized protein n=1 Tax=Actinokineospora diospyrosa TaxID=103728 RepID=A0ABT1ILK0_9PSEU|nr:hypothetical protein [Actinokineospora diospyrosa]
MPSSASRKSETTLLKKVLPLAALLLAPVAAVVYVVVTGDIETGLAWWKLR